MRAEDRARGGPNSQSCYRSGLWEFQVITPRHGPLLHGSERKRAGAGGSQWKSWKMVEANWELVEASGSCGRHREAVEDMWETRKGSGGVWEVWKRSGRPWESAEEAGRHRK